MRRLALRLSGLLLLLALLLAWARPGRLLSSACAQAVRVETAPHATTAATAATAEPAGRNGVSKDVSIIAGSVIVETHAPKVRIVVGEDGTIRITDVSTGQTLRLNPDTLELVLGDGETFLRIAAEGFTFKRGAEVIVTIRRRQDGARRRQDGAQPARRQDGAQPARRQDGAQPATGPRDDSDVTRKRPPWADAPVGEWQVLNGHEGLVSSVRFSPDGRTAASASWDGTVRLWDVAGGRPLWAFNTRGDKRERIGQVYAMVFSPDGREVIASGQGQVWVLDAKTGREIRRFNVNLGFIRGLAVLPDGERLLVGGTSVWLVDLATGRKLRSFEEPTDLISSLQVSPDGRLAMWSGAYYTNSDTETDALVKVWELETGKPVFEYAPDVRTGIHQAIFSPDGTRLLAPAVHQQEQLVLWDIATDKRLREFPQYDNVYGLAFSPDGRRVVCGDIHGLVRVFSVNSGELIHSFKSNGKSSRIESVDVSPDGRLVISGSASGAMRLWRLPALATQSSSWSAELRHMLSARRGREAVLAVAISPNGDQALSAHRDLTLRLWDLSTGRELKKFQGDRAWHLINDIAWSPDGQYALLGGGQYIGSQRLTLWDVKEWQEMRRFEGHENPIACVAFSPNGRTALSGTGEGDVFAWDVQTGERISHYDAPVRKTLDLAFSPDGRYGLFAGGYRDHRLRLFDIRTGRERHVFEQPDSAVVAAVFGDGGQQVLSASEDGLIRVWNAHRGTSLREFNVSGEIHSAAFSDDGRLVLVGGSDGTLRLWNVEAEEPVLWLVDHRQFGRHGGDRPPIAELDLSSDMQHAVSSIPTDPIFVWELHKDELIDGLQQ